MRDQKTRGNAVVEFALMTAFILLPMFLFTYGIGFNLLQQLEVVQVTRDAGHLFVTTQTAVGTTDFQDILEKVGATAGLPGSAQVYLYRIIYVDNAVCKSGVSSGSCANIDSWVIAQFWKDPSGTTPSGFTPFLTDPSGVSTTYGRDSQGQYQPVDYVTNAGLNVNAAFSTLGIVPYAQNPTLGLPTGQTIYFVQTAATPFNVAGVTSMTALSDFSCF
jgi:hypothetical protein